MLIKPLALVGMMGAGKSTVAALAADRIPCPWYDLDRAVEARAGRSLVHVFRDAGEAEFRRLERIAFAELADQARPPYIAALGGGAVLSRQTRGILLEKFCVIWLKAPPDVLYRRAGEGGRPLAEEGFERFCERLVERESLYREVAGWELDTGTAEAEDAAVRAVAWWKEVADEQ